jgi:hypothetical protein
MSNASSERQTATQQPGYGQVNREYGLRLATTAPADDGPIWMLNLMSYKERAEYADGDGPDVSGQEADDLYAPTDVLADIGAEVVFLADVDTQLLGHSPTWHRVAIVEYPTRRAFIDMQSRPDFAAKHVHKEAGMASTIVMGCLPIELPAADWVDWADVPHPSTNDDGPVAVLHVIKYAEGGGRAQLVEYQQKAFESAGPAGVRIGGWFEVEDVIVGDGRSWDEVRVNLFPSKAAFMGVALDPARLAAQAEHRESAMADTYTMILRPTINDLPGNRFPGHRLPGA